MAISLVLLTGAALAGDQGTMRSLHERPSQFFASATDFFRTAITTGLGILLLVVSARLVALEYHAGTVRVLLGRGVGRFQLLFAKVAALAVTGCVVLAVLVVLAAAAMAGILVNQTGGVALLRSLDDGSGRALAADLVVAVMSIAVCVLLGAAAGSMRSMAVGIGAAIGFFPVDNGLIEFFNIFAVATGKRIWNDLGGFLLGPVLNVMPAVLSHRETAGQVLIVPANSIARGQALGVIGVFCALFLLVAMTATTRDVTS
ncbi:MAG: ABC transporter permease subunit [Candidatus Dormibacteraeota bacterium]|nr:ABC transporter permease subunit [Candidatus Dormibacteraeota bacterium]